MAAEDLLDRLERLHRLDGAHGHCIGLDARPEHCLVAQIVAAHRSLTARLAKAEASRDALRSAIDAAWAIAQAALAPGETNHAE